MSFKLQAGKRYLIAISWKTDLLGLFRESEMREIEVLEISPKGDKCKIVVHGNFDNWVSWEYISTLNIIEELK